MLFENGISTIERELETDLSLGISISVKFLFVAKVTLELYYGATPNLLDNRDVEGFLRSGIAFGYSF